MKNARNPSARSLRRSPPSPLTPRVGFHRLVCWAASSGHGRLGGSSLKEPLASLDRLRNLHPSAFRRKSARVAVQFEADLELIPFGRISVSGAGVEKTE